MGRPRSGDAKGPADSSVTAETILAAERIGEYFKAAAINVFVEMGTDQVTNDAIYLLGRIRRLERDEVSERDLFTAASRGRFRSAEDLKPVLRRLVDHGFLIPLAKPQPTGGRPASPRYRVIAEVAEAAEGVR